MEEVLQINVKKSFVFKKDKDTKKEVKSVVYFVNGQSCSSCEEAEKHAASLVATAILGKPPKKKEG